MIRRSLSKCVVLIAVVICPAFAERPRLLSENKVDYKAAANEVMRRIEQDYSLGRSGLYTQSINKRHLDFMWGNGVMLSALVGAARQDGAAYSPRLHRFVRALDRYWDSQAAVPGYEPSPTQGGGHDKYYDDNAWMVLAFTEAYAVTRDANYLKRADATMAFVLSGEDATLGGGIWWHEQHKDDSKNTCVSAPTIVGLYHLAPHSPPAKASEYVERAKRLTEWTTKHLELPSGLYADKITATTGAIEKTTWSYNTGLMVRAYLAQYRRDGDAAALRHAERIAEAADALLDPKTRAYHDGLKFTHLMAEADIELYRVTDNEKWLGRAITTADVAYTQWKTKPPEELIDNAALARLLWLLADLQSEKTAKPE